MLIYHAVYKAHSPGVRTISQSLTFALVRSLCNALYAMSNGEPVIAPVFMSSPINIVLASLVHVLLGHLPSVHKYQQ